MTPEEIDAEFKRRLRTGENEQTVSDWYKAEHVKLITERKNNTPRPENEIRKCEVCLVALPVRRGRPPKRCEEHTER